MDMLSMMKHRRSIRKYLDKKVDWEKLEKIAEAGIYAPNPGGAQGTTVIMLDDAEMIDRIGVINAACENRNWSGRSVSADQPSIIDDLSIKSGFYGCPALGIVCIPKDRKTFVNGIGAAFTTAENMVIKSVMWPDFAKFPIGLLISLAGIAAGVFVNKRQAKTKEE